jgi:UDP-N-acetylglucosamine acyltransferase
LSSLSSSVKSPEPVQTLIDPSARVHPEATLGEGVEIGPFAYIGPHVTLGARTRVGAHAVIDGWTTLGEDNVVFPSAIIGTAPQDLRYTGQESYVTIGDRNVFREFVTVNRAYNHQGHTIVGNDNMLMAYTHVAHNCVLGNSIIMTNYVGLAGHVTVEDFAVLGGYAGVHQFVRIGRMAMVGGTAKVIKDIPPFATVDGQPARIYEINSIGLKRRGIASSVRTDLRKAFRLLTRSGLTTPEALAVIRSEVPSSPEVDHLVRFCEAPSHRGLLLRLAQAGGSGRIHRGGEDTSLPEA